jgi:hypothetical protein
VRVPGGKRRDQSGRGSLLAAHFHIPIKENGRTRKRGGKQEEERSREIVKEIERKIDSRSIER